MVGAADAEHVMFQLRPPRPDTELEPAPGKMVHGDRLLGEQRWMTVDHPGHEQPDPDPCGRLGHRGEQRPALEQHRVSSVLVDGGEMVERPAVVEAGLVSDPPYPPKGSDRRATGQLEADPDAVRLPTHRAALKRHAPGPRRCLGESFPLTTRPRDRTGILRCASGPMLTAYRRVPMPTVPPSRNPASSTVSSIAVRTTRMECPRLASPTMRPSRGPGPSPAPM